MKVNIGSVVVPFVGQSTGDKTVRSDSCLGNSNIVLYFYPKDNTPGCISEGVSFSQHFADFQAANTVIFGVSRDSLASHERFKMKYSFPFDLICDSDQTLCKQFDAVKPKKLFGKEFVGIERCTFLIDKQGVLQHEWRKVRIKGHVEDVLQAARALEGQIETV